MAPVVVCVFQRMSYNLLFLIISLFIFQIVLCEISDLRKCGDLECKKLIGEGITVQSYKKGENDDLLLSFPNNANVKIYSKEAGQKPHLWGVEIDGKRGYVPRKMIKEQRTIIRDLIEVPTESRTENVSPDREEKKEDNVGSEVKREPGEISENENLTADDLNQYNANPVDKENDSSVPEESVPLETPTLHESTHSDSFSDISTSDVSAPPTSVSNKVDHPSVQSTEVPSSNAPEGLSPEVHGQLPLQPSTVQPADMLQTVDPASVLSTSASESFITDQSSVVIDGTTKIGNKMIIDGTTMDADEAYQAEVTTPLMSNNFQFSATEASQNTPDQQSGIVTEKADFSDDTTKASVPSDVPSSVVNEMVSDKLEERDDHTQIPAADQEKSNENHLMPSKSADAISDDNTDTRNEKTSNSWVNTIVSSVSNLMRMASEDASESVADDFDSQITNSENADKISHKSDNEKEETIDASLLTPGQDNKNGDDTTSESDSDSAIQPTSSKISEHSIEIANDNAQKDAVQPNEKEATTHQQESKETVQISDELSEMRNNADVESTHGNHSPDDAVSIKPSKSEESAETSNVDKTHQETKKYMETTVNSRHLLSKDMHKQPPIVANFVKNKFNVKPPLINPTNLVHSSETTVQASLAGDLKANNVSEESQNSETASSEENANEHEANSANWNSKPSSSPNEDSKPSIQDAFSLTAEENIIKNEVKNVNQKPIHGSESSAKDSSLLPPETKKDTVTAENENFDVLTAKNEVNKEEMHEEVTKHEDKHIQNAEQPIQVSNETPELHLNPVSNENAKNDASDQVENSEYKAEGQENEVDVDENEDDMEDSEDGEEDEDEDKEDVDDNTEVDNKNNSNAQDVLNGENSGNDFYITNNEGSPSSVVNENVPSDMINPIGTIGQSESSMEDVYDPSLPTRDESSILPGLETFDPSGSEFMEPPSLKADYYKQDEVKVEDATELFPETVTDNPSSENQSTSSPFDLQETLVIYWELLRMYLQWIVDLLPEPIASSLIELQEDGVSPRIVVFTVISSIFTAVVMISYFIIKRNSNEKKLMSKLCIEEKSLFAVSAERDVLKEEVESLKRQVTLLRSNVREEQERLRPLEVELLNSQNEASQMMITISSLQEQLKAQEDTVQNLQQVTHQRVEENQQLSYRAEVAETEVQRLQELIQKTENELDVAKKHENDLEVNEKTLQKKIVQLEESQAQLLKEAEIWNERVKELSNQLNIDRKTVEHLQETSKSKDIEIESLKQLVKEIKVLEERKEKLTDDEVEEELKHLMDVSRCQVEIKTLEEEKDMFKNKFLNEESRCRQLEDQLNELQGVVEKTKENYNQALQDKTEAQTKLDVLSNYFKEKETQLQKELGAQEAMRQQKEGDATSIQRQLVLLEQENSLYKSQLASMKQELEESERSFKSQVAVQEKKAHENWLAARTAERKLEEAKQEAITVRQRLTLLEREREAVAHSENLMKPLAKRPEIPLQDSSQEDGDSLDLSRSTPALSKTGEPVPLLPPLPSDRPIPPPPLLPFDPHYPPPPPPLLPYAPIPPFGEPFPPPHFPLDHWRLPPPPGAPPLHLDPHIPPPNGDKESMAPASQEWNNSERSYSPHPRGRLFSPPREQQSRPFSPPPRNRDRPFSPPPRDLRERLFSPPRDSHGRPFSPPPPRERLFSPPRDLRDPGMHMDRFSPPHQGKESSYREPRGASPPPALPHFHNIPPPRGPGYLPQPPHFRPPLPHWRRDPASLNLLPNSRSDSRNSEPVTSSPRAPRNASQPADPHNHGDSSSTV